MSGSVLIENAIVLTLDADNTIFQGDVLIEDGRISNLGALPAAGVGDRIEAKGCILLPGFVQTHLHLCQTLFRGMADDLSLIDWLKTRIWPMEAAHTPESLFASARLGIAELIRGGTTSALTMETVRYTDAVFEAIQDSGLRATVGKCLMDRGDGVPDELLEDHDYAIAESVRLMKRWHGLGGGRIRYCLAPRFALSCSRRLLDSVATLSRQHGVMVHTHAAETRDEVKQVESETGRRNIEYLDEIGLVSSRSVLAHCVWLTEPELEILASRGAHVAHCPSSNLKLGSGIAQVPEMLERGISVSLGADGASCNNRLDMFTEMRLAALIQKPRSGPAAVPALTALRMATMGGARALGFQNELGSIEIGKRADMILVDVESLHTTPAPDPVSTLVYAAEAANVKTVIIDGRIVMRDRELLTMDEGAVRSDAIREASRFQPH
jgi:5-methylthioadenosine/S-adenosylhomocysteine deaminase